MIYILYIQMDMQLIDLCLDFYNFTVQGQMVMKNNIWILDLCPNNYKQK